MKRLLLLSATTILSAVMSAQTVERMDNLKPEQKSMAISLKLTGELSTDAGMVMFCNLSQAKKA